MTKSRVTSALVALVTLSATCGAVLLGFLGAAAGETERGAPPPTAGEKRVWAASRAAWIYAKPRLTPNGLGYLRAGASVRLSTGEPVRGPGCANGWYAVEPEGYICADQRTAFEPNRFVKSMQLARPTSGPLPFKYALSNHAPMYRRLPTPEEWQHEERFLGEPGSFGELSWGNRGHEKLAIRRAIEPSGATPVFFADGGSVSQLRAPAVLRRMIPLGSMLAYTRSFEHAGRTWLFSADGTLVPADRVRPFRESSFEGVQLDGTLRLPLAWVRSEPEPRYVRTERGTFEATSGHWPVRSPVPLAAEPSIGFRGDQYWRTLQNTADGRPSFVRAGKASIVGALEKLPWGIDADEKWIEVSITRGVLVAYRGRTPVFTTLVSPGAGGVPVKGRDHVKYSTTPMGRFRVTFKHLAQDMSPDQGEDRRFWIAEVPYTQYFDPPFALHVAYWHENFGDPMSAGCINLSPRDGKWLFEWTGPRLPTGWNGVAPSALGGKGTLIIITR
ncbi:MAG TPA: L,D-transpeptidase [Polyangiaceae bacterium]|nr:L,D-transpeptidase [Polyangiaceae bacterium]